VILGPSMSDDSSRASSEVHTRQRTLPGAAANCCGAASGRSKSNTRTSFSCPANVALKLRTGFRVRFDGSQLPRALRGSAGTVAVLCKHVGQAH